VDHAIANAGLVERPGWFDAGMRVQDVGVVPDTVVLDVNLKGVLYFSRIACAYLAHGRQRLEEEGKGRWEKADKSLTLVSSVAGFQESPGLFVYQASKHGVLGLMRALRLYAPGAFGVRVNAVCPWMTLTRMVSGIEGGWREAELPTNSAEDVAGVIGGLVSAGPNEVGSGMLKREEKEGDGGKSVPGAINAGGCDWGRRKEVDGVNGRAIYVEGGRAWDVEEGLAWTQHLWLGRGPCERLVEGQRVLGEGGIGLSKQQKTMYCEI
jgi:NAD(P)-dependent dehydrogenase (short-subunit alcohol dehydrogenase family)